jgi:hypothetical protein
MAVDLQLVSSKNMDAIGATRHTFRLKGPNTIDMLICPATKLVAWSFADGLFGRGGEWRDGRNAHMVALTDGREGTFDTEFWIDVAPGEDNGIADIAVSGHIQA